MGLLGIVLCSRCNSTAHGRALWCYPVTTALLCCVIYGEGSAPTASMRGSTYYICLSEGMGGLWVRLPTV